MTLLRGIERDPDRHPRPTPAAYRVPSWVTLESFNDGDLSNYTGATGLFEVTTDVSYDGPNGLRYRPDSAFTWTFSVTFSGDSSVPSHILSNDTGPAQGDRFRLRYQPADRFEDRVGVVFAASDIDNFYELVIDCSVPEVRIIKRDSGVDQVLANEPFNRADVVEGEWHIIEGRYHFADAETLSVHFDGPAVAGIASVYGTDSEYTSGQFGFSAARNDGTGFIHFDYLQTTE